MWTTLILGVDPRVDYGLRLDGRCRIAGILGWNQCARSCNPEQRQLHSEELAWYLDELGRSGDSSPEQHFRKENPAYHRDHRWCNAHSLLDRKRYSRVNGISMRCLATYMAQLPSFFALLLTS